jgi:hypothetical protein
MRTKRSRNHGKPTANAAADGLSRRGWLLLVGVTTVVGVALLVLAIYAIGNATGRYGAAASVLQAVPPPSPDLQAAPAPRGLPPRPTPTLVATGPSTSVDSLTPGDCLQTYDSKWADGYPVVDCAAPHIAQLLSTGVLPQPAGASFPGTGPLDTQVSDLCEPFLNWDWVAIWNEDVQLDLRYPNTSEKWATGARSYYCFVYTFSRHELTGSAVVGQ